MQHGHESIQFASSQPYSVIIFFHVFPNLWRGLLGNTRFS